MLMKMGVGICERQTGLLSLAYIIVSRKVRDLLKWCFWRWVALEGIVKTGEFIENSYEERGSNPDKQETDDQNQSERTSCGWCPDGQEREVTRDRK